MIKNKYHNLNGEQFDQLLTLVDKTGKKLGTATRSECHNGLGKPHLAFLVCVFDEKGRFVLTLRNSKKSLWGDFWDAAVVSHVLPEETVIEASKRRAKEELGVEIDPADLGAFYYHAGFNNRSENEYCHVLTAKISGKIDPNPVEISDVKRLSLGELFLDIQKNPQIYTPWLKITLAKFTLQK